MKKISLLIGAFVLATVVFSTPVSAATCKPKLMNILPDKNAAKTLNKILINKEKSYSIKYRSTWDMTNYDFDNFTTDNSLTGVSSGVPVVALNGNPGPVTLPLKKTKVIIGGRKAEWQQSWDKESCAEYGKIVFKNKPLNWYVSYNGTKDKLPTAKAMIYSIRFLDKI